MVGVLLQTLDDLVHTLLVPGSNRIDGSQYAQSVLDRLGGVEAEVLAVHRADELNALRQAVRNAHGDGGSRKTEEVHRDDAGDFESDVEEIAASVPTSRGTRLVFLSREGVDATRRAILESFDGGASVMSYVGHGGIHLWAHENVFNIDQVSSLAPQPEQPLVLTLNCLNGYFHFPYFNALGEELVKAEGKGAIAAFSPTGLSLNEPAHVLHQALLAEIASGRHARLGDAVAAAQASYASAGAYAELLQIYHLLGDPALLLR